MSPLTADAARLRLTQLQGQASALRQSLALYRGAAPLESGTLPTWLPPLVAEMVSEVGRLLPDPQFFQHASTCGLALSSPGQLQDKVGSAFDCEAFLGMAEAAAAQYTGGMPSIGFHAAEQ